jgi:hypothetical protein
MSRTIGLVPPALLSLIACGAPAAGLEDPPVPPGFAPAARALVATGDAAVWAGLERDNPHGDGTTIQVKTYDDNDQWGWAYRRGFLRIPLDGLAPEDVGAVHLALFGNLKDGTRPVTAQLYALHDEDDDWSEHEVTWATQPPRRDDVPTGELGFEHVLDDFSRYAELGSWQFSTDLAAEVRRELGGNGVLGLRIENETRDEVLFFTQEHEEAWDLCPRLVVLPPDAQS